MCGSCRRIWAAASAAGCDRNTTWRSRCLAARALQRSVRLVLIAPADVLARLSSRQHRARCAWSEGGRHARCDHARGDRHDLAVTRTSPARTRSGQARSTRPPTRQFTHKLARLDVSTPGDMRAPGAASGVYALECAMDELAVALKLDPLELRYPQLLGSRPERRHSLHQQGAARMLPPRRGRLWLGAAQSAAALHARRTAILSAGAWRPAYGRRSTTDLRSASC